MTPVRSYTDKDGNVLKAWDKVRWDDGRVETLYPTTDGELGVDATNPMWIKLGRADICEYGIYPLTEEDMKHIVKEEK